MGTAERRYKIMKTMCRRRYETILHLCSHLYKEATTVPWIKMKRDMTFYKYCDIYMLISEMSNDDLCNLIFAANENGLEKEFSYCLNSINCFFKSLNSELILYISGRKHEDLNEVISPSEKTIYRYTEYDVIKRFFTKDRLKLLSEVVI